MITTLLYSASAESKESRAIEVNMDHRFTELSTMSYLFDIAYKKGVE